ncbi:MAG: hypothetical protein WA731_00320 [Pseudonocardiaceae bacterium]
MRPGVQRILDAMNAAPAYVRKVAGTSWYERTLSDLVGELSTRSETFRTQRDQAPAPPGRRRPDPDLRVDGTHGGRRAATQRLHSEPGTPSQDSLNLLASWTATAGQPQSSQTVDGT